MANENNENLDEWTNEDETLLDQLVKELMRSDLSDLEIDAILAKYPAHIVDEWDDMCGAVVAGAIAQGKEKRAEKELEAEAS